MTRLADQARFASRLLNEYRRGKIDRREFMLLTAGLSAVAIATACSFGGTTGSGNNGRIHIPFYTTENDSGSLAFLAAAIQDYQTKNPNVDISINLFNSAAGDAFLVNAFRSNHDVGIFSPNVHAVPGWAQAGYLAPLDDLVKAIGTDDFYEGTRIQLNGHDWSMPFQVAVTGLWYRKDILSQVGIKEAPTNYDDLIATLKEVHGRNGMIGMAAGVGSGEVTLFSMHPYVLQSGWGYFTHDAKLTFNQPEVFDGVTRFVNVMNKYSARDFYNCQYDLLLSGYVSGRAVFGHYTGRLGSSVLAQNPQVAAGTDFMGPAPGGPFMTGMLNHANPRGYCIYAKTQSPKDALSFLQSIVTGDNAVRYALVVPGQFLPPMKSVSRASVDSNNKIVQENALMKNPTFSAWMQKIISYLPYWSHEALQMGAVQDHKFKQISNVNPFSDKLWNAQSIDTQMVQEILLNGMDPKQAWQDAYNQMDQIAKQYLKDNPNWKPAA
jgi:ABC-type glycerol-3-phosphate transport system substrate-binding protein